MATGRKKRHDSGLTHRDVRARSAKRAAVIRRLSLEGIVIRGRRIYGAAAKSHLESKFRPWYETERGRSRPKRRRR